MAKTLEQGFDTFIGWLQPLDSEHNKAKSHKDSVQSCMENNFDCSLLFETGSFGHGQVLGTIVTLIILQFVHRLNFGMILLIH